LMPGWWDVSAFINYDRSTLIKWYSLDHHKYPNWLRTEKADYAYITRNVPSRNHLPFINAVSKSARFGFYPEHVGGDVRARTKTHDVLMAVGMCRQVC
jgi:hypothetical protein